MKNTPLYNNTIESILSTIREIDEFITTADSAIKESYVYEMMICSYIHTLERLLVMLKNCVIMESCGKDEHK